MQPHEAAAPLPALSTNASDLAIWEEFAALLDETRHGAATIPPDDAVAFYQPVITSGVEAIAAIEGAVWQTVGATRRRLAQAGAALAEAELVSQREQLLTEAAAAGKALQRPFPGSPVVGMAVAVGDASAAEATLIELLLPSDRSPAYYEAAENLLTALAESAAVYENRRRTTRLEDKLQTLSEGRRLANAVSGDLRLDATAMRVANESAASTGADRVAVLLNGRVIAVSGVHEIDCRGPATLAWQRLAKLQPAEPVAWPPVDGQTQDEAIAVELDRVADVTHARSIEVAPIHFPRPAEDEPDRVLGLLVAEWFDASITGQRLPLAEAAVAVAPALSAAEQAAGRGVRGLLRRLSNGWIAIATTLAIVAAITVLGALVQVEHTITATGVLTPIEERGVFAPSDATVAEVLVTSGDRVSAGQLLGVLSDPRSLIEIEELNGQIEVLQQQHAAALAQRLTDGPDTSAPADRLRLAAEQQRLQAQLDGLRAERDLMLAERNRLRFVSPIDGVVTTWQADTPPVGKPVARGELLLMIANDRGPWRLELEAPEDRYALIAAASDDSASPLTIEYEANSSEGSSHTARLTQIAPMAVVETDAFGVERRSLPITATPQDIDRPLGETPPLPGASIRARIHCGKRSLAYVALHDAWHTLTTWWRL